MSDKTCSTCDLVLSNPKSNLYFCDEGCDYVGENQEACEVYQERTDSVEQVAFDAINALEKAAAQIDIERRRDATYAIHDSFGPRLKALGVEV